MYRCCALLFLSAMATFLRLVSHYSHEFTRVHTSSCGEEVPPVPRRKSWSSGDPWPTGVDLFDSKQGQEAGPPGRPHQTGVHWLENDTCDTTSHEHEPHVAVAHESLKLERHRTGRCKPCVFLPVVMGVLIPPADSVTGLISLQNGVRKSRRATFSKPPWRRSSSVRSFGLSMSVIF